MLFSIPYGNSKSQIAIGDACKRARKELREKDREKKDRAKRGKEKKIESRSERGNLAKGCKTSEKKHQESVKCANHGAVIGGNYDNSIPRARAIVRVHSAHVCICVCLCV